MFFTKTKVTTILMVLEAADNSIHEEGYILWDLCLGVVIWRSRVTFQLLTCGTAIFLFQLICVGVCGCLGVDIYSNNKFITGVITVSHEGTCWSPMAWKFQGSQC